MCDIHLCVMYSSSTCIPDAKGLYNKLKCVCMHIYMYKPLFDGSTNIMKLRTSKYMYMYSNNGKNDFKNNVHTFQTMSCTYEITKEVQLIVTCTYL